MCGNEKNNKVQENLQEIPQIEQWLINPVKDIIRKIDKTSSAQLNWIELLIEQPHQKLTCVEK